MASLAGLSLSLSLFLSRSRSLSLSLSLALFLALARFLVTRSPSQNVEGENTPIIALSFTVGGVRARMHMHTDVRITHLQSESNKGEKEVRSPPLQDVDAEEMPLVALSFTGGGVRAMIHMLGVRPLHHIPHTVSSYTSILGDI